MQWKALVSVIVHDSTVEVVEVFVARTIACHVQMKELYNRVMQMRDTLALASERAVWCMCGGRQFSQAAKPNPLT